MPLFMMLLIRNSFEGREQRRSMLITISGYPLSGKGTVGRMLAQELMYRYWSAGDVWREEAAKLGISMTDFKQVLTADPSYDQLLDERQAALHDQDALIIDSRMGFHFLPIAFKVFLTVHPDEAAQRLLKANRAMEVAGTAEEARAEIETRVACERTQYIRLYGVDHHDSRHYHVVIDTTAKTPEEVLALLMKEIPFI